MQLKVPTLLLVVIGGLIPILLVAILILSSSVSIIAWQPPNTWSNQFGASGFGNGITTIFATTSDVYVGGYLGYPLSGLNSSVAGATVARYDQNGHQIWSMTFGKATDSEVVAVSAGAGEIVAAGQLNDRAFLRAYDPNGSELWTNFLAGGQVGSRVFDAFAGGQAVYTSWAYSTTNGSVIDELQTNDLQGHMLWNYSIGQDLTGGRSLDVYSSPDGLFVSNSDATIGHGSLQHFDTSGVLKWTTQLDCDTCFITGLSGDGSALYLAGYLVGPLGSSTFFLSKYDLMGNRLWSNQFSDPYFGLPHMSADSSGVYLVLESVGAGHAGSVRKYNSGGGQEWSFEPKAPPYAVSAGGGNVFVGGSTEPIFSGGPAGSPSGFAFIAGFWQSSSLILFGLNPPFSFILSVGIAVAIVAGLLWHRKRWLVELRERAKKPQEAFRGVPRDAFRFQLLRS